MATSELSIPLLLAWLISGCTLGDYSIPSCQNSVGEVIAARPVGALTEVPSITRVNGGLAIMSFVASGCVQGVAEARGTSVSFDVLQSSCSLLNGLAAAQPSIVPSGSAYAAVAIATTAPCQKGQLSFASLDAAGPSNIVQLPCDTGAALPAVHPLDAQGAKAVLAWYGTPFATRSDPIQACSSAAPAPLEVAIADAVGTKLPSIGSPIQLTDQSISLRPPAITFVGSSGLVIAAPNANRVSIWSSVDGVSFGEPLEVPLDGARAVSVASAEGSDQLAIVAEIGCAPQSIAFAAGSLASGFSRVSTLVPKGAAALVHPSVAWIAAEHRWMVSWVEAGGGGRVFARRVAADGTPLGGVIDPRRTGIESAVDPDGSLVAYEPQNAGGSVVKTGLGCGPE